MEIDNVHNVDEKNESLTHRLCADGSASTQSMVPHHYRADNAPPARRQQKGSSVDTRNWRRTEIESMCTAKEVIDDDINRINNEGISALLGKNRYFKARKKGLGSRPSSPRKRVSIDKPTDQKEGMAQSEESEHSALSDGAAESVVAPAAPGSDPTEEVEQSVAESVTSMTDTEDVNEERVYSQPSVDGGVGSIGSQNIAKEVTESMYHEVVTQQVMVNELRHKEGFPSMRQCVKRKIQRRSLKHSFSVPKTFNFFGCIFVWIWITTLFQVANGLELLNKAAQFKPSANNLIGTINTYDNMHIALDVWIEQFPSARSTSKARWQTILWCRGVNPGTGADYNQEIKLPKIQLYDRERTFFIEYSRTGGGTPNYEFGLQSNNGGLTTYLYRGRWYHLEIDISPNSHQVTLKTNTGQTLQTTNQPATTPPITQAQVKCWAGKDSPAYDVHIKSLIISTVPPCTPIILPTNPSGRIPITMTKRMNEQQGYWSYLLLPETTPNKASYIAATPSPIGALDSAPAVAGISVELYAYWLNDNQFLTTNKDEIGATTTSCGVGKYEYRFEGSLGRCFINPQSEMVPLYQYYLNGDHYYTTTNSPPSPGYGGPNVVCYIWHDEWCTPIQATPSPTGRNALTRWNKPGGQWGNLLLPDGTNGKGGYNLVSSPVNGALEASNLAGTSALYGFWSPGLKTQYLSRDRNAYSMGGYGTCQLANGWQFEGILGYCYPTDMPGRIPLRRYYVTVPNVMLHYYHVTDEEVKPESSAWEAEVCYMRPDGCSPIQLPTTGRIPIKHWKNAGSHWSELLLPEGTVAKAGYIEATSNPIGFLDSAPADGITSKELYAYWSNENQFLTTSEIEIGAINTDCGLGKHLYRFEGSFGRCFISPQPGLMPLYQYYHGKGDHYYTTTDSPPSPGYEDPKVVCYIWPDEW